MNVHVSSRMYKAALSIVVMFFGIAPALYVSASTPLAGGDTTVVNPSGEGAVSITEDAVQPESANIRLIVPTLSDPGGGTPSSIRIISVTGGTLWQSGGGSITLGTSGTTLSLSSGKVDLRFRPDAGRDTNATFQYAVVDPHSSTVNSTASTATISITAINDDPILTTSSGSTGLGLAATYYLNSWELTGSVFRRIDQTVNFGNNFGVTGLNAENFSARWIGQVKSPITGDITFSTVSDDGVRLWVNGNLIIDNWTLHGDTTDTASAVSLVADTLYDIRMEFYERGGGETARLQWAYSGQSTQIIPQAYLFPAITRPVLSYITGAGATVIDDAVTISDVDNANLASSTVVISSNFQSGEDSLSFSNQNGITGSYSAGTLTLNGTASVANYQTALRSVKYTNSSSNPNTTQRTIEFKVSDGTAQSNATFRNISYGASNSAPVITEGASTAVTMDSNASPTAFSLTLNATDADFHSITWSISGSASHGEASVSGTGDSKSIQYTPDTNYIGSDSFLVQASDGAGGTDTITVNVTVRDRIVPVISSVGTGTISGSGATVTWTTNEAASTKIAYSVNDSYASSTSETDTSSRVTSHSRSLANLLSCTTYSFKVVSADAEGNYATSTRNSFTTSGCSGGASPSSATSTIVTVNASSVSTLTDTSRVLTVETPANFTTATSSVVIQIKGLSSDTVLGSIGKPSGSLDSAAGIVFNVTALVDNITELDSFDAPVTVSYTYTDADMSGINENSLSMYHYANGSWSELDDCVTDTGANMITCDAPHFSIFAIFGSSTSSAGMGGGGSTIQSRVRMLTATGHYATAEKLKREYPHLFPDMQTSSVLVRDLKKGNSGEDVRILQKFLNAQGYKIASSGPGSPGFETSFFGAGTHSALAKFQAAHKIKPSAGYFGPVTRAKIKALGLIK